MTDTPAANAYSSSSTVDEKQAAVDGAIDSIRQIPGTLAWSALSILTGSVTPTQGCHTVDTQGDVASDDLDTIVTDNLPDGYYLRLSLENSARIVTIRDNQGGDGEIYSKDGHDIVFPPATEAELVLQRRGADWYEVERIRWGTVVEANTAGSGSPNILDEEETGKALTNEGAGAQNYHTLPSARAGLVLGPFIVQDANGIRIVAASGDTIRIEGQETPAAGYVEATTVGNVIELVAINATEWIAKAWGTWTVSS